MSKRSKAQERRAMAILGLDRTPLSGSLSRITSGDGIRKNGTAHPAILADNKDAKRHRAWKLMDQITEKARKEGDKIPILTLTQPHKKGVLICLRSCDWEISEIEATINGVHVSLGFNFYYRTNWDKFRKGGEYAKAVGRETTGSGHTHRQRDEPSG